MVRNITGYGQGKGPYISFHDGSSSDIISPFAPVMETSPIVVCVVIFVILPATWIGFQGTGSWAGYMSGADRLVLDSHPYLCFVDQDTSPLSEQVARPCTAWAKAFNTSMDAYGITVAGEWSLSFNDCAFLYHLLRWGPL